MLTLERLAQYDACALSALGRVRDIQARWRRREDGPTELLNEITGRVGADWLMFLCQAQYYAPTIRWPIYHTIRGAHGWYSAQILTLATQPCAADRVIAFSGMCTEYRAFLNSLGRIIHHVRNVITGSIRLCPLRDEIGQDDSSGRSRNMAALPILLPDLAFVHWVMREIDGRPSSRTTVHLPVAQRTRCRQLIMQYSPGFDMAQYLRLPTRDMLPLTGVSVSGASGTTADALPDAMRTRVYENFESIMQMCQVFVLHGADNWLRDQYVRLLDTEVPSRTLERFAFGGDVDMLPMRNARDRAAAQAADAIVAAAHAADDVVAQAPAHPRSRNRRVLALPQADTDEEV